MKISISAILLFILSCSGLSLLAQTRYDVTIQVEGRSREFIVSVPTTPPPPDGYPMVIMHHGSHGDKNEFYNLHGWKELGEEENFVAVFPSSLDWCFFDKQADMIVQSTRFVNGSLLEYLCASDTADLISDILFDRRMVEVISDTLPINTAKVFASGFSNGSAHVHKLAMDAGDVFAASAGTGGGLHELDSLTPENRIPVWFMVGSNDDRFFDSPWTALPYGGDSILVYMAGSISRTLACQGLTQTFEKFETNLTKTYQFTECRPGETCAPFRFTLIKDLGHNFPNGNNHDVDAPRLFWLFYNNPPATVMTAVNETTHEAVSVTCFPNPSTDNISIWIQDNNHDEIEVSVYSLCGITLFRTKTSDRIIKVSRDQVGAGQRIVEIKRGDARVTKQILFF